MAVTVEMLETFLRQPPPRQVPPEIRRKALRAVPGVLLLIGMLLALLGVVFVSIFFPHRLLSDLQLSANSRLTRGYVVSQRETSFSENERRVVEYRFEYEVGGQDYHGVCFSSSVRLQDKEAVDVLYAPSQPTLARIKGCRLSKFGWGAAAVVVVPAVGVVMVYYTSRARRRIVALLARGRFALGRVSDVSQTVMKVNNQPVYRVEVRFATDLGREATASYRVIGEDGVRLAREKMATQTPAGVLYDEAEPTHVLLVDELLG